MREGHRLEELIFWYVFDRPSCLRSDLAHQFGISPATVHRAVSSLLSNGLLVESSAEVASFGRKPQSCRINPRLSTLVGLDIQLDGVVAVVTDIAGALLGRGAVRCNAHQGADAVVRACLKAAEGALEDAEIPRTGICHIGVGHSGDLDIEHGVCVSWANAPSWKMVPIRDMLASAFGLAVTIDDRSRAVALAERRTSPEDWDHSEAIYVSCAAGVGMGVFLNGRLYRGASRGGGEIGHTVVDASGPVCRCGNRGCVEAFAGTVSLLRYVQECLAKGTPSLLRELRGQEITLQAVGAAAHRGDALAAAALERAASALGVAVANTVQILNPSLVVLCGQLVRAAGPEVLGAVRRAVQAQCVATAAGSVEIRLARPKKDIAAVGCALLAAEAEAQRVLRSRFTQEE